MSVKWRYMSSLSLKIGEVQAVMAKLKHRKDWLDCLSNGEDVISETRLKGPLTHFDIHRKIPVSTFDLDGTIPKKYHEQHELVRILEALKVPKNAAYFCHLRVFFEHEGEVQKKRLGAPWARVGFWEGEPFYGFSFGSDSLLCRDHMKRGEIVSRIVDVVELPVSVNEQGCIMEHRHGLYLFGSYSSLDPYPPSCFSAGLLPRSTETMVDMLQKTVDNFSSGKILGYEWSFNTLFLSGNKPIPDWMSVERDEDIFPQVVEKFRELEMPAEKIHLNFTCRVRTMDDVRNLLELDLRKAGYLFELGQWNYTDADGDKAEGRLYFIYKKNEIYLQMEMPTADDISEISEYMGVQFRKQKS